MSLELLQAMGVVLASWFVLAILFVGLGLAGRRLLCSVKPDADELFKSFWFGFAIVIIFLQVWRLFLPVDQIAFLVILVCGLSSFSTFGRGVFRLLFRAVSHKPITAIVIFLITVWMSNRAIGPCTLSDTGVYHAMAVRWAVEYPVVPGLGNLMGNLAFNNSSFLFSAMLESGGWSGRSFHITNGLLLTMLLGQVLLAMRRLQDQPSRKTSGSIFDMILLVPVIFTATRGWIPSFSTDLPAIVIAFVAASAMFKFFTRYEEDESRQGFSVLLVIVLFSTALCLKLSTGAFSAISCVCVLAVWFLRARRFGWKKLPVLFLAFGFAIICIGTWMAAGVIMTGYPLFPTSVFAFDVDWRVPVEHCEAYQTWLNCWTRRIDTPEKMHGFGWLAGWYDTVDRDVIIPVIMMLVAAAVYPFARLILRGAGEARKRPSGASASRAGWLVVIIAITSSIVWFFTVPQPRFGFFLFWTGAAAVTAMCPIRFVHIARGRIPAMLGIAVIVITAGTVNWQMKNLWNFPGTDAGFHPMKTAKLIRFTNRNGLTVFRPDMTPPAGTDQSWYAPLPCTTFYPQDLKRRRPQDAPNDFSAGFAMKKPMIYPYPIYRPNDKFTNPSHGPILLKSK